MNKQTGKIYRKFTRVRFPDGVMRRMPYIYFHKPSDAILKVYDRMRDAFTDALNERTENTLRAMEQKEMTSKQNPRLDARKLFRSGIKPDELSERFDVSSRTIYRWVDDLTGKK